MQHKDAVGGTLKSADPGLTGVNPTASIEAWVINPSIPGEETIVSWGHRNGPDGSNMSFNYGFDARWGAIGHWGAPDIGWDGNIAHNTPLGGSPPGVPAAGEWHHLVYTFDGATQKIYIDGVLKNSENIGLNTWPVPPITIAGQLEDDAGNVTGGLRGSLTIGRLRIHQEALTAGNVANNYSTEKADFTGVASFATVAPTHRYRFANAAGAAPDESPILDSIGTAHGTVQGANATFTGSRDNSRWFFRYGSLYRPTQRPPFLAQFRYRRLWPDHTGRLEQNHRDPAMVSHVGLGFQRHRSWRWRVYRR
jgi:hypothetical protein